MFICISKSYCNGWNNWYGRRRPNISKSKKVGTLLASSNLYDIDVVACKIINLNPNKVLTVQRSIERNFLKEDFSDICILRDNIENMLIKDFKIPQNKGISFLRGVMPKNIEIYINKKLSRNPVINHKKCLKCRECSRVCPPGVISIDKVFPDIDLQHCIR